MLPLTKNDIEEFLMIYPRMDLLPFSNEELEFKGVFECRAKYREHEYLDISYEIKISIPNSFPNSLPKYFLTDKRIEQDVDLHLQRGKEICLGVPLNLMEILNKGLSLCEYTNNALIPYLYGLTYKIKYKEFPFDEVEHFGKGLINEYKKILSLPDEKSIINAFELLCINSTEAHLKKCPCGCSNPYFACEYRNTLEKFRSIANTEWFRKETERVKNNGIVKEN